jgi:hypothetical protein
MDGIIKQGKLRRIQAVLNEYMTEKSLPSDAKFDWEQSKAFINRGRGNFIPVQVKVVSEYENYENIYAERTFIENKLKAHFLIHQ